MRETARLGMSMDVRVKMAVYAMPMAQMPRISRVALPGPISKCPNSGKPNNSPGSTPERHTNRDAAAHNTRLVQYTLQRRLPVRSLFRMVPSPYSGPMKKAQTRADARLTMPVN